MNCGGFPNKKNGPQTIKGTESDTLRGHSGIVKSVVFSLVCFHAQ